MATWGDFVLAETVTGGAWTTISSAEVEANGLIIGYAAHHDSRGAVPSLRLTGIKHHIIGEFPATPYRAFYPYSYYWWWYRRYGVYPTYAELAPYYYFGYPGYWSRYWRALRFSNWHVNANLILAVADEAGTVELEALGKDRLSFELKVYDSTVSPGAGLDLVSVNFNRSESIALPVGAYGQLLTVKTDDLVVLHGADLSPYYASNALSIGGGSPTTQTLLDKFSQYATHPGAVRTKVLRIKADGILDLSWTRANAGFMAARLAPYVQEKTSTPPESAPAIDSQVFYELQTLEDLQGNRNHPKAHLELMDKLKYSEDYGLFQDYIKGEDTVVKDDLERESVAVTRHAEIFSVPSASWADAKVIPNALFLEDLATLKARDIYHKKGW